MYNLNANKPTFGAHTIQRGGGALFGNGNVNLHLYSIFFELFVQFQNYLKYKYMYIIFFILVISDKQR